MKNLFIEEKLNNYKNLNKYSKKGGTVCFGSSWFEGIDFGEIALDESLDCIIHNRSIKNLTVTEAKNVFEESVKDLNPSKIFVNIGEEDINDEDFNMESFLTNYELLLLFIHRNSPKSKIFIVSLHSDSETAREVNEKLYELSENTNCKFIRLNTKENQIETFNKIKPFIRNFPISFAEAMMAN